VSQVAQTTADPLAGLKVKLLEQVELTSHEANMHRNTLYCLFIFVRASDLGLGRLMFSTCSDDLKVLESSLY
jgi:hypothetical protein